MAIYIDDEYYKDFTLPELLTRRDKLNRLLLRRMSYSRRYHLGKVSTYLNSYIQSYEPKQLRLF